VGWASLSFFGLTDHRYRLPGDDTIPTGNMMAPPVAIQKWMALLSVASMLLFGVNFWELGAIEPP
jgi:hypothetical protein